MGLIHTKHFVTTITAFTAGLSLVCAIALLIAPTATRSLFALWFHGIDLELIAKTPTIGGIVLGLITLIFVTLILSWLFAALWNALYRIQEANRP